MFRLFTVLLLALFFLPDGLQHGLFMDGIQYAVISKNLANAQGGFWFPFLSPTWSREGLNAFMEHPPLFYFLEARFFRLFGDHFFTEKLFCLLNLLLSAWLIHLLWKVLFRDHKHLVPLSWLPVTLWIICPTVSWVFRNNLIENSLSVFVLASVLFSWFALQTKDGCKWIFLFLSGLCIFLASLIKGLPGLFPLVFPVIYFFTGKKLRFPRAVVYSSILLAIPALVYFFLWNYNAAAKDSLGFYLEHRLLNRIQNDPTVSNNFSVLFWLLSDLAPSLGLLFLLYLGVKPKPGYFSQHQQTIFYGFLALGLAGVLPICLTKVQREMYYVPALPFFAIALAAWIAPALHEKLMGLNRKVMNYLAYALLVSLTGWLIYSGIKTGSDARDHEVLEDVRAIGKIIGKKGSLYGPIEVYTRWDLQFYLLRYYSISLSAEKEALNLPRIYNKGEVGDTLKGYRKSGFNFYSLDLFQPDTALVKQEAQ